ncbi:MAG TPA: metallophosphoesterase, partial [Acidimicrobiales bacterium]|nr:metallophosphoesterase [Acidimicrobiales bacterium]
SPSRWPSGSVRPWRPPSARPEVPDGAAPLRAFAVEDTTVQLTWSGLPTGEGTVGVGPCSVVVSHVPPAWVHRRGVGPRRLDPRPHGPGAALIEGLEPETTYEVWWKPDGGRRHVVGRVRTLRPPPGEELFRFATLSDLHLGERRFGFLGLIEEVRRPSEGLPPYPVRAAEAALQEAAAWGATTVVLKGDLTSSGRPDQFRLLASLLDRVPMGALAQLGNHDARRPPVDLAAALPGVPAATGGRPLVVDRPGVRLVLADSPSPSDRRGHVDGAQAALIADAVSTAPTPSIVTLHHPPQRWPVPLSYPPGLVAVDRRRLLAALARARPAPVLLAGHTHRNRTYRVGPLLVAEVGSTKDYPGGWAGYVVHEGGLRQVVRRTARPDVLRWTESTARALGGAWGRWSPGRLSDRCWSHPWGEKGAGGGGERVARY